MKVCTACGQEKDDDEFAWKNRANGKRHGRCKQCHKDYSNQWYKDNRTRRYKRIKENQARYRQEVRDYIWDYLSTHPCVDCGESDPLVLEFDHRGDKEFSVCYAVHKRKSLKATKAEVEKCDVRCANCHRRKTALDGNWWADKR